MTRGTFDRLVSVTGLVVAAALMTASVLLLWAHDVVDDHVRTQLTTQRIVFPAVGSAALDDPRSGPHLREYAGLRLTTARQARAYADHVVAAQLADVGGGLSSSELAVRSQAAPGDAALRSQVEQAFRGEALRARLLDAAALGAMAEVALVGACVAVVSGLVLLVLAVLGLRHGRRTSYDVELAVPTWHPDRAVP